MDITLTPQISKWINDKVSQGLYSSINEVVADGLRLLIRQEEQRQAMVEDLRHEILVGVKQLDSGKSTPFDDQQVNNIKALGRKRAGR